LDQACDYFDLRPGSVPAAMQAASGFVSMPMFPGRADDRIVRVCQCVKKFHSKEPQGAMR
jgi:dTDP-4-amino-4,6-dideoxygalactose transaminase